ncbi:glycosyl hydrolase family 65 protein, partial [Actinotalea sp.]|uniref:glycosyl hydrolase family 65 protein n=1 Tax=Actinotalea sp. TaxID=1872145 RepID=UPI0035672B7E
AAPAGGIASLRFAAVARPGVVVRGAAADGLRGGTPLALPDGVAASRGREAGLSWAATRGTGGAITAVARQQVRGGQVERMAAYVAQPPTAGARASAAAALREALDRGVGPLLAEQREHWARQWEDSHVAIPDDPDSELALRLALFHLLGSAGEQGEAAVGARGLSGPGYRGHVFWDADVFVLPALAAVRPRSARAMLEYRLRRLGAARERARAEGRAGARFPWESGRDGTEITPDWAPDPVRPVAILTGEQEVHIVADVAWAACRYAAWTGDRSFLAGRGLPLVVEGARYWADRARWDGSGRAHLEGVIGPDEYHSGVSDNAFTNVMARWNLRAAASLAAGRASADERAAWSRLAGALVDGYDPATGTHEQFTGFGELEPFSLGDLAGRPFAADVLLGPEVVGRAQIVKQADVVMAHHLVPDELPAGSLEADLDRYLPLTCHGSSLSPGVHASVLARAGRSAEALRLFRVGARIDLDDLARTTGAGVHLAGMGGLWQAYAQGFFGLVPTPDGLQVDPRLPEEWGRAELGVRFGGSRVRVSVEGATARVVADRAVPVLVGGRTARSRGLVLRRVGPAWSIEKEGVP